MKQILIFIALCSDQNWKRSPPPAISRALMLTNISLKDSHWVTESFHNKQQAGIQQIKAWPETLSWILYEFSNQLQERGVFHSRKIFLDSAKTMLQWIYTKTAKSDGMEGPSRNLLIGRKVSLKSFHTSTGAELVPTPTHWQARLWFASSPSFLPSAKEDNSRKALEVLHDVREG